MKQRMKTDAAVERVSQGRLPQNELMLLKDESGFPVQLTQFSGRIDNAYSANADAAFRYRTEQRQTAQQRGLARTGRPEKNGEGAGIQMYRRGRKRRRPTVPFGNIQGLKHTTS